jgi:Flp pilus assembly protein TadG
MKPRRWRNALSDDGGAVAVEYAIIGTPFLLALFAVFEIAFSFFQLSTLDNAVQISARAVMTGTVSTGAMSASTFKTQVVCPSLPSLFTCSNVVVNMSVVPASQSPTGYYSYVNTNSSGLIQPAIDGSNATFCPGSGSQYVVLQILYPASFITTFFAPNTTTVLNGKKVNALMATATFKTEPYAGAATYAGC